MITDSEITRLLSQRDKLLTRRDGLYSSKRVAAIEKKLNAVEPGRDNRVDLALGRMCATLEKYAPKVRGSVNPSVTMESINFSEEHQYLVCTCGYCATGLIDGIKHHSECNLSDSVSAKKKDYTNSFEAKPGWFQNPAVTLEDDSVKELIETTRKLWSEAEAIEY